MPLARATLGLVASAALVIATAACTGASAPRVTTSHTPTRVGTAVVLPTSNWEPTQPAMDALLSGTLMLEPDGCVVVRNGAVAAAVIWPHGFSGNRTADGTLEVLNPKGKVVARIGQHVSYGGGFDVGRAVRCGVEDRPVYLVEDELPPLAGG